MKTDVDALFGIMGGALRERLGDEVELIFHFGSTIRGNAHESSDIDVCWVPAHEETWASITIELEGVLIDLFALHWSQLTRMAEFDDCRGSFISRNRVLYARDAAALERFQALGARRAALQEPGERKAMLEKSFAIFQKAAYPLYILRRAAERGEALDCVAAAQEVSDILSHCLMALNQRDIDTRKDAEVLALPLLPAGFADARAAFASERDAGRAVRLAGELMESVRGLLLQRQADVCSEVADFAGHVYAGDYPETANGLRHAARQARLADPAGANRDMCGILREIRNHIGHGTSGRWFHEFNALSELTPRVPGMDLDGLGAALLRKDWADMEARCLGAEKDLAALFAREGAAMNRFEDSGGLAAWLRSDWKG